MFELDEKMRYTRLFECDNSFEESVEIGPDLQSALGQQTLGKSFVQMWFVGVPFEFINQSVLMLVILGCCFYIFLILKF